MLVNIIQSDRFWTDLQNIINIFEPCLYILRLCDRESPAMDQLYFYVRKMDGLLPTLKETLNVTEDKYNRQTGPNLYSKVINYFLRSKEKFDTEIFFATLNDNEYDSDDDSQGRTMKTYLRMIWKAMTKRWTTRKMIQPTKDEELFLNVRGSTGQKHCGLT